MLRPHGGEAAAAAAAVGGGAAVAAAGHRDAARRGGAEAPEPSVRERVALLEAAAAARTAGTLQAAAGEGPPVHVPADAPAAEPAAAEGDEGDAGLAEGGGEIDGVGADEPLASSRAATAVAEAAVHAAVHPLFTPALVVEAAKAALEAVRGGRARRGQRVLAPQRGGQRRGAWRRSQRRARGPAWASSGAAVTATPLGDIEDFGEDTLAEGGGVAAMEGSVSGADDVLAFAMALMLFEGWLLLPPGTAWATIAASRWPARCGSSASTSSAGPRCWRPLPQLGRPRLQAGASRMFANFWRCHGVADIVAWPRGQPQVVLETLRRLQE